MSLASEFGHFTQVGTEKTTQEDNSVTEEYFRATQGYFHTAEDIST
jgi:hypothetical protein